jgi:hypothetical protein
VLLSSTSNTLRIANAQLANAGNYRVIVTNSISAVTSIVATLTVVADTFGPTLVAAIGNNNPGGGSSFGSNTINVLFSESVDSAPARNTNSYTLTQLGTTNTVHILSALYSTALGVLLIVDPSDPDWIPGGDYVLTVSYVTDTRGNVIAPDSQIAVSWRQARDVIQFTDSLIFDPEVFATNWYACDFIESLWWSEGHAPFCVGFMPPLQLPVPCADCVTPIYFQSSPTLFRNWFHWPPNLPTTHTTLRLRFAIDDGAVFYLNGIEIARYNMPREDVVIATIRAVNGIPSPSCVTNFTVAVSNLTSGSNCFSVAVSQASLHESDTFFGLNLEVNYMQTPSLHLQPVPTLAIQRLGSGDSRLSWTGGGYALESATNLSLGSASHPLGPWHQVPNMSNPHTNRLDETQRFFRLKK